MSYYIVIRSQEGHETKLLLSKSFDKPAKTDEYVTKVFAAKTILVVTYTSLSADPTSADSFKFQREGVLGHLGLGN